MSMIPDPLGDDDEGAFVEATTIPELIVAGCVTLIGTSPPTGLPALVRDRWIDVDRATCPTWWLAGWQAGPKEGERGLDPYLERTVIIGFAMAAKEESGKTARAQVDLMHQWLQRQLIGVHQSGSPLYRITIAVRLGEVKVIAQEGDILVSTVEIHADYTTLVGDATKWG